MPFRMKWDFDFANVNEITEKNLQDASFANYLTDSILNNVEAVATQIYKSGDPEEQKWPQLNEKIFDNVSINGKPINALFEKIDNEGLLNSEMRYKRKMLMISDAIIRGKPVEMTPYNQNKRENIVMNQYCPGFAHKPMSVFQKMLARMGFSKYKRMAVDEKKYKAVENQLKAVGENLNEQGKWQKATFPDKTKKKHEFLDQYFADHENFLSKQKEHYSLLEKQYLSEVKSDKVIDNTAKMPALLGANGRNWITIATLAMLQEGFSLKDACDPNNAEAAKARAQVGIMLKDLGDRIKDPIQGPAATKELNTLMLEGTKKYLSTPMPSQEELFNFKKSDIPQYYIQMMQISVELFEPLEKALPTISNDVSDLKVVHMLEEISMTPAFFNIINCTGYEFNKNKLKNLDKEGKEGVYTNLATHELIGKMAKEKSVSAPTLSKYVNLNQAKPNEVGIMHYETALRSYLSELIEQPTNEMVNVSDMFSDKVSVDDMLKKTPHYADAIKAHEAYIAFKGTDIDHYNARLDLASTISDKMFAINNVQPTAKQKYEKVYDLFHNKAFLTSTLKSVPEVKSIRHSKDAVNNLATQINTVLNEEENSLKTENCKGLAKSALKALYANEEDKYPTKETEEKMIKKIISTNTFQSKINGKNGKEIGKIHASDINEGLKAELTGNNKNNEKAAEEGKAPVEHQNIKKEENRGMNM